MWINTALNQRQSVESPHIAKVTAISDSRITTASHIQAINVPIITSLGIDVLPDVGDDVVLLPAIDGGYYCIGKPVAAIADGELKISTPSGNGYIHINSNGDISLNGLIISKEGKIIAN